ncbi:MAG: hemolysin III family protein [Desulfuromonadales bacterium]|nr:hemolysin III family protein [Desulfuromonadales bacterium]NIR33560.1 hemolysin III family protein [Desulfuromonadales bacterium]NIS41150.1 hemolysin III family protein [Desulfuromonadales bacterium]
MKPEEIKKRLFIYSEEEEVANRLTHGLGALLSLIGLVVLIGATARNGEPWRTVACTVFGGTLLLFYATSTIYHSVERPHLKYVFRILDHVTIYFLIAGTYTPFTLVTLHGKWGWSLFGVVWGLAVAGSIFKAFMPHRLRILAPTFYIAMGWIIVIAIEPLQESLPRAGIAWLLAGGIAYTGGVLFYAWNRLPYNHAIWHVFVMAGSLCHYLAVLWYVVPLAGVQV